MKHQEFFEAYEKYEADCDREFREKYPDAPDIVEFAEDGDAYPHGIGGTNWIPKAVTAWVDSPHYVE